ncbi:MAG: ATP-binding cassette domain-containing protein, partial [Acidimicrobiales bacterium]
GEVLLVAGDAGSGKSTLLRTVNGLVPHSTGGRFGGEVLVGGRSTRHNRPRDFADVVGFVHQDPEAHFVVDRVEHYIAFVLENLGTDAVSMRRRIEEVLDALGIAHLRHRSPATLSSGERQRCAVAGALASGPTVLVLDEPTSMLDPQGADDVFAAVTRLNADLGTTVVLAEHRLERAAPLADRAVLMVSGSGGGSTQAPGDPAAVLSGYAGAPTVTHLGRVLGWEPPPLTIRQARSLARTCPPQLGVPGAGESCTGAASAPGEVLVAASGLEAAPGPAVVLHAVDLEVRAGEVVALLGRNGSGKTTLLRCLAGLLHPRKGRIDRRAAVAYVPQDPSALLFADTVRAELVETTRLLGRRDQCGGALARHHGPRSRWPPATRVPCPPANDNGSPSPQWPWAGRRCCCSTSRPAASTPRPGPRSKSPSPSTPPAVGRLYSPPMTWSWPPAAPPGWSCSVTERWSPPVSTRGVVGVALRSAGPARAPAVPDRRRGEAAIGAATRPT